jgi:hypothetical protein
MQAGVPDEQFSLLKFTCTRRAFFVYSSAACCHYFARTTLPPPCSPGRPRMARMLGVPASYANLTRCPADAACPPQSAPPQTRLPVVRRTALARPSSVPVVYGGRSGADLGPEAFVLRGGRSLGSGLRADMEARFGHDFSGVRVHDDERSDRSAKTSGAVAYTRGSDIYFRRGRYEPDRPKGRQLLAHELAHVVQQSNVSRAANGFPQPTSPGDRTEIEADRAATAVMLGERPVVSARVGPNPLSQRQTAPPPVPSGTGSAAPTPAPPTTMSISNVSGPTPSTCSAFLWQVNFTLPSASPAGGYFVQDVTISRNATDCSGTALAGSNLNYHYWEAWHVARGGTQDELVANGTFNYADQFSLSAVPGSSRGSFSFTGSVRFFEGLSLPASFVANNPATIAGDLPSTSTDPHLAGGTAAQTHNISGTWNCCPATPPAPAPSNQTTISSHTP